MQRKSLIPQNIQIRLATPADFDALGEAMFDAVRNGPSPYTQQQREAWVPVVRSGLAWAERLASQNIYLAEQDRTLIGFMSLATGGYIDLAFIRPSLQGTGLFRKLLEKIETNALTQGETRRWVHASLMVQPAFTAHGFEITEEQLVNVGKSCVDSKWRSVFTVALGRRP